MKKQKLTVLQRQIAYGVVLVIALGLLGWRFATVKPTTPYEPDTAQVMVEQPEAVQQGGEEKAQPEIPQPVPPRIATVPNGIHKKEIAIIIDDVGLDMKGSKRAINLPGFITLSFMPYASRLREQTKDARDNGHELMLHMPMEPIGHDDPGPGALLVDLSPDEIRQRLDTALASFVGFDGVNNHMGSKFTADADGMDIVITELQQRHLFFIDSRTSAKSVAENVAKEHGLPTLSRDVFLDDDMSPEAVRGQLEQVEKVATRKGYAVAIGHPHAVTLDALQQWIPEAQAAGFTFVPVNKLIPQPSVASPQPPEPSPAP
jgi:polysaccharide deacetylase 2 family uncharacterized protein YibQ